MGVTSVTAESGSTPRPEPGIVLEPPSLPKLTGDMGMGPGLGAGELGPRFRSAGLECELELRTTLPPQTGPGQTQTL